MEILEEITNGTYVEEELNLSEEEIDTTIAIRIFNTLKSKNHNIKKVNLAYNNIGDEALKDIHYIKLEELNLKGNKISSAAPLSTSNIYFLNLTGNPLYDKGASCFAYTPYIRKLYLSECEIEDAGAKSVLKNTLLEKLDLSNNKITCDGVSDIPEESSIKILNLDQNKIGNDGVGFITRKCKKIEEISLHSNHISDAGTEFFIDSVISNLSLVQNKITSVGFTNLCRNKNIKYLRLFNNQINFKENEKLPLEDSNLIKLGLGGNQLNDDSINALQQLTDIYNLEELDLCSNNISAKITDKLEMCKRKTLKIKI